MYHTSYLQLFSRGLVDAYNSKIPYAMIFTELDFFSESTNLRTGTLSPIHEIRFSLLDMLPKVAKKRQTQLIPLACSVLFPASPEVCGIELPKTTQRGIAVSTLSQARWRTVAFITIGFGVYFLCGIIVGCRYRCPNPLTHIQQWWKSTYP